MKILVVDDDPDLLSLVGFALTQSGFVVVKAVDVPSALQVFEAESPDLAILDINLPGGSGFDICTAIRRQSRIPVMMLTARGEEEDLVRALDLGADDYLTKPFSPRTLLARVRALIRADGAGTRLWRVSFAGESSDRPLIADLVRRFGLSQRLLVWSQVLLVLGCLLFDALPRSSSMRPCSANSTCTWLWACAACSPA